jgi:hypothetical protein
VLESSSCSCFWKSSWFLSAEIPGSIDARNGDVDYVLDDFRNPICREGHENNQSNDLGLTTTASTIDTAAKTSWVVFRVYGYQCHREPSSECRGDESTNERHNEDVSVVLRDVDDGLEHQDGEGNSRNPAYETNDVEDRKDEVDDCCAPPVSGEIDNRGSNAENDLQDARDPDSSVILISTFPCPTES